ncbi:structural protein [Myroides odoratimimus]|uniref:hypothetical protein n=1 Tax=Myroides odoratimimus TaxID=76832 RepID=UPI0004693A5A|nr:hypothetical protein [Myroides odoratimimus]
MRTEQILQRSRDKAVELDKLIDIMEDKIQSSSSQLTKSMYRYFILKLKHENGIVTDVQDAKTVLLFNIAYSRFTETYTKQLIKNISIDLNTIINSNANYYRSVTTVAPEVITEVKKVILKRMGIRADGTLIKDGFLNGMFKNDGLKADMFKTVFSEITKGTGYEALKKTLKNYIEGTEHKVGNFKKYYKVFSYDTYATVNAFNGALYASKLNLKYFIYNGGIIKTSRKFCIERNGKVFSSEEADKWVNDPDLTAITDRETYNWKIDRGGYGCRHGVDYIPYEIAVALRPDLAT